MPWKCRAHQVTPRGPCKTRDDCEGPRFLTHTPSTAADAYDERPIKGRGSYVLDAAALEQLDPNAAQAPSPPKRTEGPRPPGVPDGFPADLPLPEPLSPQHAKDAEPLLSTLGEYVTRACFSKTWQLREAGLLHVATRVVGPPGPTWGPTSPPLRPLVRLAVACLRDKVANVAIAALGLLRALCEWSATTSATAARDVGAALPDWLPAAVEKACDSNTRVKDAAVSLILYVAAVPEAHLAAHASVFLRPMKQPGVPRVALSRLQLLTSLVPLLGVVESGSNGLALEPLVRFVAEVGLASANADVRAEATSLAVELATRQGAAVLRLLPGDVHAKIREQVAAAAGVVAELPAARTPAPVRTGSGGAAGGATAGTGSTRRGSARGPASSSRSRGSTTPSAAGVAQAVATVTAVAAGAGRVYLVHGGSS